MSYLEVLAGSYALGSRLEVEPGLKGYFKNRMSPVRWVTTPGFSIWTATMPLDLFLEGDEEFENLHEVCDALDRQLEESGLRLPTEDEWEIAFGGHLRHFPWGDEIPDGIPYGSETTFTRHKSPTAEGLDFNPDTYKVELTRTVLKLATGEWRCADVIPSLPPGCRWRSGLDCSNLISKDVLLSSWRALSCVRLK